MRMPVVNVREVRVAVLQVGVKMHMGVRFHSAPVKVVAVLVMGIVPVRVPVEQFCVVMRMGVVLGQMKDRKSVV